MSNQSDNTDAGQGDEPAALDQPIWGARRFAEVLKLPGGTPQANYLLMNGRIDASKCGKLWVSTPRRLLRSVGIEV
jgi:hypothetical protein